MPRHLDDLRRAAGASANFLLLKRDSERHRVIGPRSAGPSGPQSWGGSAGGESGAVPAFRRRDPSAPAPHAWHAPRCAGEFIHMLDVPFDFTVHDYFTICPRVNLLPMIDSQHCGEPAPALCNDCIAQSPANGARDIQDWRHAHRWIFL